jgi:hypothetical protein
VECDEPDSPNPFVPVGRHRDVTFTKSEHLPERVPQRHVGLVDPDPAVLDGIGRKAHRRRRRMIASVAAGLVGATALLALVIGVSQATPRRVTVAGAVSNTAAPTSTGGESSTSLGSSTTSTSAPTSSSTAPDASTTSTTAVVSGVTLTRGTLGFSVPEGWTFAPLTNYGGPGSFASWTNPSSPDQVVSYSESGTGSGLIYNSEQTPNLTNALGAARCSVTSSQPLSNSEELFTCDNPPTGTETRGLIVVRPYATGWFAVSVTAPTALDQVVTRILNSARGLS